jgi:hypothetical protein
VVATPSDRCFAVFGKTNDFVFDFCPHFWRHFRPFSPISATFSLNSLSLFSFESNACRQSTSSQTTLTTTKTTATVVPQDCCYELSQHLIDRRVDALERKYGGLVARESATRIQRAFRTYRLQKRFKSIAIQALRQTTDETTRRQAERQPSLSDTQSTRSDDSSSAQNSASVFIPESLLASASTQSSQAFECQRKRSYRVGLNLFNKQ